MVFGTCSVVGHSMFPFLKPHDKIFVSSLPYLFRDPAVDDIVVFVKDKKKIIKRIKKYYDEKYLVKGDNEDDSKDFGWIKREDIVGKFIFKI